MYKSESVLRGHLKRWRQHLERAWANHSARPFVVSSYVVQSFMEHLPHRAKPGVFFFRLWVLKDDPVQNAATSDNPVHPLCIVHNFFHLVLVCWLSKHLAAAVAHSHTSCIFSHKTVWLVSGWIETPRDVCAIQLPFIADNLQTSAMQRNITKFGVLCYWVKIKSLLLSVSQYVSISFSQIRF